MHRLATLGESGGLLEKVCPVPGCYCILSVIINNFFPGTVCCELFPTTISVAGPAAQSGRQVLTSHWWRVEMVASDWLLRQHFQVHSHHLGREAGGELAHWRELSEV